MDFALHTPLAPLDQFVECLWFHKIPVYKARELILPSQFMELIVNFGAPHRVLDPEDPARFEVHAQAWLAGMQSRYITIESDTSHMVGARLKPGGAAAFLSQPIRDLSDKVTPLNALFGPAAARLRRELLSAEDPEACFTILEHFLLKRFEPQRPGLDMAMEAVRQIQESGGRLGMRDLSIALGVSQKHLIDLFTRLVGLRPKQFARVVRLSALLPALEGESSPDWAQLAQLAGYHDQAHFNREFRLFAGLSPRKYISLRKSYFEHYPSGDVDARFVPLG